MIYDSKTNCFGIEESIFSPRRDSLLLTKTNCFGVMMISDAFKKAHLMQELYKKKSSSLVLE
jgi:hypothetical protein